MTRRDIIIELVRTLRDAQGTDSHENGHGGRPESRILQETHLYHHGSYRDLERQLDRMRLEGDPTRQHRWHLLARHHWSQRKPVPCRMKHNRLEIIWDGDWQPATPRHGNRQPLGGIHHDTKTGRRLVTLETWHNHVQPSQVDAAINWLSSHLPSRIWLPEELAA